jgi:acetamidase/formamidase
VSDATSTVGSTILQPSTGDHPGDHVLPATVETTLWGRLPCAADRPVLTVASGDSVTIDTVSHEGILEDQGGDPVAFFARFGIESDAVLDDAIRLTRSLKREPGAGPHIVTRPIAVDGALPGDVVSVTLLEAVPRVPYGIVSNRHGRGALAGELPRSDRVVSVFADLVERNGERRARMRLEAGSDREITFPIQPFLGIVGVSAAGEVRPHSVPPGSHGGNLDISLLTTGSTLHLPVLTPGAGVTVGDPHFAQGDGEVALTALEGSLRTTIRLDLLTAERAREQFGAMTGPIAETSDFLVPTGLDEDLDAAVRACVRAAIRILQARWGIDEHIAYAYLSAATDFRISQVVDLVCGVHATIRKADFDTVAW